MKVAYLGPAGTFSEDALRAAAGEAADAVPTTTVHDAIQAVGEGRVDLALVPFENSIEGSVRSTLDALAFDGDAVTIVGQHDHPIHHSLIARSALEPERIEVVLSHPQVLAQCARFLREELPEAEVRAASSSAEAIRAVSREAAPWAALGAGSAAALYGCTVLRDTVEDEPDNVTRFVWVAPAGSVPSGDGVWRTTLVFSELGEDHPGALVDALTEFSSRAVNLTRIESRPLRRGLGRYMFFVDLEGKLDEGPVAAAIDGLRGKAESVRIIGSYPVMRGVPSLE
ncbi:MAG: prephenate dehydratase [Solirubrobacterales bacterium]|jgi:prephenate dehydratase|nr:prephenate dehydratase [Solirubrobacterales bacterium]